MDEVKVAFSVVKAKYESVESFPDLQLSEVLQESICISLSNRGVIRLSLYNSKVILDYENDNEEEDSNSHFFEDVMTKCDDFLQENPTDNLVKGMTDILDIIGMEFSSSNGEDAYTYMGDEEQFDGVYEYGKSVVDPVWQEEHHLRQTLLSNYEKLKEAREAGASRSEDVKGFAPSINKCKTIFSEGAATKILISDLIQMMNDSRQLGYDVEAIDGDVYNWRVQLNEFDSSSMISADLRNLDRKYNYNFVELRLSFAPDLHPFFPPLVTLIRPRFQGFMIGKLATMKSLQPSNWDPVYGPKDIISYIRTELEADGRIDFESNLNSFEDHPAGAYSDLDHLLLKLCMVTEMVPRAQLKCQEVDTRDISVDAEALWKKRKHVFRIDERLANGGGGSDESVSKVSSSSEIIAKSDEEVAMQPQKMGLKKDKTPLPKGTGYGSGSREKTCEWDPEQVSQLFTPTTTLVFISKSILGLTSR
jgi:hypothetical protein